MPASTTIRAIALLAESASDPVRRELRSGVKRLLLDAQLPEYQASSSIHDPELASAALDDPACAGRSSPRGAFAFSSMDRFVHRAKTYAFAVSGSSSRITELRDRQRGREPEGLVHGRRDDLPLHR